MATKNLTRAIVDALAYDPNGASRQVTWDKKIRGFGVRVTPGDGKQYVLSYRFNGRSRLMSLGPLAHFASLDAARAKAEKLLHGLRHEGIDPLGTRESLSNAVTVSELWAEYWTAHLSHQSANTQRSCKSIWSAHLEKTLGHLKPQQVQGSDCVKLHDKVTRDSGPVIANRCITRVRALFTWAAERDERLFGSDWKNPANKAKYHQELPRTHVLDVNQMRALVASLDAEFSPLTRTYILLLMLTGARKDEIRCLKWSHVDLARGTATLDATKNGTAMVLMLPPLAVEILQALPVFESSPFVFPEQRKTTAEPRPMIEPRRRFKAALKRAELPTKTTFHDLRRSYGTALARRGASASMVAAALNNTSEVAARHYIQLASNDVRTMAEANALALTGPRP